MTWDWSPKIHVISSAGAYGRQGGVLHVTVHNIIRQLYSWQYLIDQINLVSVFVTIQLHQITLSLRATSLLPPTFFINHLSTICDQTSSTS